MSAVGGAEEEEVKQPKEEWKNQQDSGTTGVRVVKSTAFGLNI